MAKRAYIGVDNRARNIKCGYVGINTKFPIYSDIVEIKDDNINEYFKVSNGTYSFPWNTENSEQPQFKSNNKGKKNSLAETTLTALQNCRFSYTYIYGSDYGDEFTITENGYKVVDDVSGTGKAITRTINLVKDQSIIFEYSKDSSGNDNGDYAAFYNLQIKVQTGTAHRDVARKIKKAYIGIGGVARPCWNNGELTYYGEIEEPLSKRTYGVSAASIGNYALFAGGNDSKTVEAYNNSLTKSNQLIEDLTYSGTNAASATIKNHCAVFSGAGYSSGATYTKGRQKVEAYNSELTKSSAGTDLRLALTGKAAASVGNCAVFAGGYYTDSYAGSSWYQLNDDVECYDSSLTKLDNLNGLSKERCNLSAAQIGDYVIFAGGINDSNSHYGSNYVDAYDHELTHIDVFSCLGEGKHSLASTSIKNRYAIFGGGKIDDSLTVGSTYYEADYSNTVDVYDSSLTNISSENLTLSVARSELAAATIDDEYAIFVGGRNLELDDYESGSKIVDVLDDSLTMTVFDSSLKYDRYGLCAAVVGDYALFHGMKYGSSSDSIEAFTVV